MGKVRSVEYDGGIKTKYIQESDGKLTINNQQDVNPLLKRNKELYNHDNGYLSKAKEMKRVRQIFPDGASFNIKMPDCLIKRLLNCDNEILI